MTKRSLLIAYAALGTLAGGCSHSPELVEGDGLLVLDAVTLIDGTGRAAQDNSTVVLKGNRILRLGTEGQFRFPSNATILNLEGHYVVPGFFDMHLHVRGIDMTSQFLAFGLTTIRSPCEPPGQGVEMRRRLERGELVGPRMFTAGISIDDPANDLATDETRMVFWTPAVTEIDIRREVRRQAELGVDYVKLYMGIPEELVGAAVAEAHLLGVKVAGHLHRTSWTSAANAGIDVLVHSGSEGPSWELVDGDNRKRFPWSDFKTYMLAWSKTAAQVDLQGPQFNALVEALVKNRVEVNPTLVVIESLYWGDDTSLLKRLKPALAPAPLKDAWWGENWEEANPIMRPLNFTREEWIQLKTAFAKTKDMIRVFHERGVLLTAGSDVGMPWITPGVSFHRELELLVSSGIPALDVLTMATRNGARALGIDDDVGTLEAGKRADVVVLRADPVTDIRNTREIEFVIKDGRRYEPADLLR